MGLVFIFFLSSLEGRTVEQIEVEIAGERRLREVLREVRHPGGVAGVGEDGDTAFVADVRTLDNLAGKAAVKGVLGKGRVTCGCGGGRRHGRTQHHAPRVLEPKIHFYTRGREQKQMYNH